MKSNQLKVKLKTKDKKIYEVPIDLCKKVKFISWLVEQACDEKKIILLREVEAKEFEKVLDYLKHYKNFEPKKIPKPFPERTDEKFLRSILNDDWTFDFLQQFNLEDAISIVNAANYLEIDGLINILAAKLAYEMNTYDIDIFKEKLGSEYDFNEDKNQETEELE